MNNDLLKNVRKIEIKTRGLSHQIFAGEYHSAFKGRCVNTSMATMCATWTGM